MQLFLVVTAMLSCFRLAFFFNLFSMFERVLDGCEPQRKISDHRGAWQASYLNVTSDIVGNKKFSTVDIQFEKIQGHG